MKTLCIIIGRKGENGKKFGPKIGIFGGFFLEFLEYFGVFSERAEKVYVG